MIASGLDVDFVSRQLGHAHPGITLEVYSHLFATRAHAAIAREAHNANRAAVNGTVAPVVTAVDTRRSERTGDDLSLCNALLAEAPLLVWCAFLCALVQSG